MTYDISYVVTHCMPATRKVAGMQLNGMKTTFPVFRFFILTAINKKNRQSLSAS